MGKYQAVKQGAKIKIQKSYAKLSEENAELATQYDQITKFELIEAVKMLANELGLTISFTYDNLKNKI